MRLVPEMTYRETIDGPWGPTLGGPLGDRLCWQVTTGRLHGERIDVSLVSPGTDWIRLGPDGVRRQDLRATLADADGEVIMMSYDQGMIRESEAFLAALRDGTESAFADQYMRIAPRFDAGAGRYAWLNESLFLGEGRIAGSRTIEYLIYRVD